MFSQLEYAIAAVEENTYSMCKFITKNESKETHSHQCGILISNQCYKLIFDEKGSKNEKKERKAIVRWYDGKTSNCLFHFYGSKNEHRITRLERKFNIETFIVIVKLLDEEYLGFILWDEVDVKKFLAYFDLFKGSLNRFIKI